MRKPRRSAYVLGGFVTVAILSLSCLSAFEVTSSHGPMNTGHEQLACADCHSEAIGTARQQLQANLRHLLGWRETGVDFGRVKVDNRQCLECHARENDNHPVFRFNEPRFAEARAAIAPQQCSSCHLEHQGVRVTQSMTFCSECHRDLELKQDPITISHAELTTSDRWWDTCLGCHDYHGNHIMTVATVVGRAHRQDVVQAYLDGASDSPYSQERTYQARVSGDD